MTQQNTSVEVTEAMTKEYIQFTYQKIKEGNLKFDL